MSADLETLGADLGRLREPEGEERRTVHVKQLRGELFPPRIADIDRGRRRLRAGEEPALRLEVLLHRAVEIEVILAQVREDERVEAHAVEAPEGRAVRAGLDGRAHVARVEHLAKQPLEIDRLGRRERRGTPLAADLPLDGPHEAGLATRRIENRAQEECRGRLPVRSRDTCDLELLRRLAEEEVGGDCHRLAHGRHEELRDIDLERPLDDDGGSTALDRLPGEVVAVHSLAADAEEERAGGHAPRVVREVGDFYGPPSRHLARRESPDQGIQLHRSEG